MIDDAKAQARIRARAQRNAIPDVDGAGTKAAIRFLDGIPLKPNSIVSLYWPLAGEFDCRPLLYALSNHEHHIALPLVRGRGEPLDFRIWRPGDPLVKRAFNVHEPLETAEKTVPHVVVTPFLAYNELGYRLGYGGGYYDRTLRGLRQSLASVVAVGLGFAAQKMPELPFGETDEPMDWLVTERVVTRFQS
jgi:5-formyltetrahydrofolate cyclo-ligase